MKLYNAFVYAVVACLPFVATVPLEERGQPTLPTEDPFYTVPNNIKDYAPGQIIDSRRPPYPIASFGISPVNLAGSWQILYRTNDNFNNATATVLTVLIPHNADYTKVLSYQVAQDSAYANCAPSYAFQLKSATGGLLGTILSQAELLLMQAALEQGWIVISPDHEGPRAAYLANKLAGHATLDGVRAALNSASFTGISQRPTISLWGYSGGAIASAAAVELQPSYAPELRIAGAAIGGVVPNITTVIAGINKQTVAGLIPAGVLGIASQYSEVARLLENEIRPEYKAVFGDAANQCVTANILQFAFQDVVGMFKDPTVLYRDQAKRILDENALGQAIPQVPMYVYKSVRDEVSPVEETDALVRKYCAGGARIKYDRDLLSDHGSLALLGVGKSLVWLKEIMNGGPGPARCSTTTLVSSLLDLKGIKLLSKALLEAFLNLLGSPVGPPWLH